MGRDLEDDSSALAADWAKAQSFADLLGLTARFLAGEPIGFPGWAVSETDEESDSFTPTLLAANAAGLLSVASQPGAPFGPGHDGWTWGGRAFIGGFARADDAAVIQLRGAKAGLWVRDLSIGEGHGITAGLRDGTPYLILGHDAPGQELEIFQDEIGPAALVELKQTHFLWVVDPVWGRRERLRAAF